MSPGLLKVAERAKRDPQGQLLSLAHLIDEAALERAFGRIRKDAAVGVDGITKEQYGQELASNLHGLHGRLKGMTYRHQPIRRVHIPKGEGKTRPIGISSIEDKIVQEAVREILEVAYEPMFLDVSYGFRPGRGAHDALRALNGPLVRGEVGFILEADIQSFFDSIDRTMLIEMLQARVADGKLLRLVGKCLHVGVLEGTEISEPETGTVQGSVLSPLLGNVYLHHVLDVWFEREVKPRLRGKATLVRYADDFVIGFEREDDAKRVMEVLGRRFERFGLKLHPDKTRLLPFHRPRSAHDDGKGPATFDFLGFTLYWRRTRAGRWMPAFKTRKARLGRAIQAANDWCRRHRHKSVKEQHATLKKKLVGHYNYFGVNGNLRSLARLVHKVEQSWRAWLGRRSQRGYLSWARFLELLRRYPLPAPRIRVQIWSAP
jgi:group II intron reverse transcriptase/maturase